MSEPETQPSSAAKSCSVCGMDVSNKPRVKDAQGRYLCKECFDKAKAAVERRNATPPAPAAKAGGKDQVDLADNSFLLDMGKKDSVSQSGTKPCPECARPLNPNATVCVGCGLNLETGKRLQVKVVKAKAEKGEKGVKASKGAGSGLFANPHVVGIAVVLFFVGFAAMSFVSPAVMVPFTIVSIVFGLGVFIWVLIEAFQDSVGAGVFCLICGFYQIYWVLVKCENTLLKWMWCANIIASVMGIFVNPDVLKALSDG